jgi:hypothetical protein
MSKGLMLIVVILVAYLAGAKFPFLAAKLGLA